MEWRKMKKTIIILIYSVAIVFSALNAPIDLRITNELIFRNIDDENEIIAYDEFQKPHIIISLGINCEPALQLVNYKLRDHAFPLDWVITYHASLFKILANDFKNFFQKENLEVQYNAVPGTFQGPLSVVDSEYATFHMHDFIGSKSIDEQYDKIKEKYDRRVARFYRALNANKLIYFLRIQTTKEETISLINVINEKFPNLNYVFVAINNNINNIYAIDENWNFPKVKNVYLHFPYGPERDKEWGIIFKELWN